MNMLFLIGTPILILAIGGLIVLGHNRSAAKADQEITALEAKIRTEVGRPNLSVLWDGLVDKDDPLFSEQATKAERSIVEKLYTTTQEHMRLAPGAVSLFLGRKIDLG